MFKKIAIVGIGLIGGSIGMAARKKRLAAEVTGIGRRTSSIKKALLMQAIDRGTLDIGRGIKDADLVIIATPAGIVIDKIKEACRHAQKGAIIIDVNSTKDQVVRAADKSMAKGIYFVGTHPLAGSEESGVKSARPGLFEGSICVVTPTRQTDKRALNKVRKFWKAMAAEVVTLSPQAHDKSVASISHLPHLLSYNLCNSVSSKDTKIAGSGFKDTTRIAKSDPGMWVEIFFQNRKNVLSAVNMFEKNLKTLKADIRSKRRKALFGRLNAAKSKRENVR